MLLGTWFGTIHTVKESFEKIGWDLLIAGEATRKRCQTRRRNRKKSATFVAKAENVKNEVFFQRSCSFLIEDKAGWHSHLKALASFRDLFLVDLQGLFVGLGE